MEKQLLHFLERCGIERSYGCGEMIFRQGEEEDHLHFVKTGMALVYTVTPEGKERNVLISWPEHFSGLATFFEGGPHKSSAVALEPCEVLEISRSRFTQCCTEFPEVWGMIATELSRDIGLLIQQTVDSSVLTAEEKVARFLVRRYAEERCQITDQGIVMKFTQPFIARVLDLSPWSVNRALKSLSQRGWLTNAYGTITVTDLNSLLAFCKAE